MNEVWTKEEQKEHRKLWINALRSGEYKQGFDMLRSINNEYCCLGVGCEVATKNDLSLWVRYNKDFEYYEYDSIGENLPENVRNFYGLNTASGNYYDFHKRKVSLIFNNDTLKMNFNSIADIIESEPEGLLED